MTSSLCPNDSSKRGAGPSGKELVQLVPTLLVVFSVLLFSPVGAWCQAPPSSPAEGSASPQGGAAESPAQTQGQPPSPAQPQPPLFVPQYPSQYPPAFQGPRPQTQP